MTTLDNHGTKIIDDDVRLIIDPDSRTITSPNGKLVLVQYDHDSERITFECPRYVDGHDMLEVDFVEVLYTTAGGAHGLYVCDDLEQDGADTVMFSWLVSRNATKDVGTLIAIVRFMCLDASGNVDYAWHTAMFKKITVSQGMDADAVMEEYPDALVQWREEVIDEAVERVGGSELAGKIDANTENIAVNTQAIAENTKAIEELSEGGGAAVQSDWEQNDLEAPDYVKNRPFYKKTETTLTEILAESFDVPAANTTMGISSRVTNKSLLDTKGNVIITFSNGDGETFDVKLAHAASGDVLCYKHHNEEFGVEITYYLIDSAVYITVGEDIAQNYSTITSIKSATDISTYVKIDKEYLPTLENICLHEDENGKYVKIHYATNSSRVVVTDTLDPDFGSKAVAYLDEIATPDWDESDTNSAAYIKNRPMHRSIVPSKEKSFGLIASLDGYSKDEYTVDASMFTVSPAEWYTSVTAICITNVKSETVTLTRSVDSDDYIVWGGIAHIDKYDRHVSVTYYKNSDTVEISIDSILAVKCTSIEFRGCTAEYEYTPLAPEYLPDLTDQTLTATDGTAYRVQALPSGSVYLIPETDPNEITDSWNEIIAALDDGTYKTKYSVHQTKRLDLGTEGMIEMEIVGIDVDDIAADGATTGEKAKLSMIAKTGLATSMRMNPPISGNATNGYADGTGTIGGFASSNMLRYLTYMIKPLFPANVKARLASVAKSHYTHDTTGTRTKITTYGLELWLPSWYELVDDKLYGDIFSSDKSRIKRQFGHTGNKTYWTRDVGSKVDSFIAVGCYGPAFYPIADTEKSVVIGFCLN